MKDISSILRQFSAILFKFINQGIYLNICVINGWKALDVVIEMKAISLIASDDDLEVRRLTCIRPYLGQPSQNKPGFIALLPAWLLFVRNIVWTWANIIWLRATHQGLSIHFKHKLLARDIFWHKSFNLGLWAQFPQGHQRIDFPISKLFDFYNLQQRT